MGVNHVSDLAIDRFIAGEIEEPAHIADCARCTARLQEFRADIDRFPEEVWIAGEAVKTRKAARSVAVPVTIGVALAAALAFLILVPTGPDTRTKGGDTLELISRTPQGVQSKVLPGGALHPGDAIRFRMSVKASGYLVILGADSAGAITPYAPALSGDPVLLRASASHVMDGSIILDDTLGDERVIAFVCDTPVPVETLTGSLRKGLNAANGRPADIAPDLGTGCRQTSLLFTKVAR